MLNKKKFQAQLSWSQKDLVRAEYRDTRVFFLPIPPDFQFLHVPKKTNRVFKGFVWFVLKSKNERVFFGVKIHPTAHGKNYVNQLVNLIDDCSDLKKLYGYEVCANFNLNDASTTSYINFKNFKSPFPLISRPKTVNPACKNDKHSR